MARRGYVQLVNGFYLNGKVLELMDECPAAVARFCMILSFCGDNLTDGYVSRRDMRYVLRATDEELRLLLMENMLEEVDEGYVVHDYTEHNRSREQVLRSRKKTAERVARHRENDDVTPLHASRNGVTSQKHQNTRTPKERKRRIFFFFFQRNRRKRVRTGEGEGPRQRRHHPRLPESRPVGRVECLRRSPLRRDTHRQRLVLPMEGLVPATRTHERHTTLETTQAHVAMRTRAPGARTRQGNRHARPTSLPTRRTTQQGAEHTMIEPKLIYHLTDAEYHRRMAKAWREGYAAGWKDQECDFPPHTTENPYKETTR